MKAYNDKFSTNLTQFEIRLKIFEAKIGENKDSFFKVVGQE
ncbi:MAG: hypothetical protein RSB95_05110 [Bacilli bacterium]